MAKLRQDKQRRDTDSPYAATGPCALCRSDPSTRHAHYLQMAAGPGGVAALKPHLYGDLQERRIEPERVDGYVRDIVGWVEDEIARWSGITDIETGQELHWRDARQQAHATAKRLADAHNPRVQHARDQARRVLPQEPPANDDRPAEETL